MKNRTILLLGITVMLLAFGNAWAGPPNRGGGPPGGGPSRGGPPRGGPPGGGGQHQAPEIDAASGTSAIALLTGVLLLVAERSRARRS